MAKIVYVDQESCIGCEMCTSNLPKVFRLNADGKAECYNQAGATELEIQEDAMDACPVSCIAWLQ